MRAFATAAAFRLALIATGMIVPTIAAQADEIERDGYRFVYDRVATDDGATVLTGKVMDTNEPFKFVVRDQIVTGNVDGRPVRFRIAKGRTGAKQIAGR
jgi:hypothetical protein